MPSQPQTPNPPSGPIAPVPRDISSTFTRDLGALKQRLVREATSAVGMLESSLDALWRADRAAAKDVRRRDDRIDVEEVAIEEACLRLMALQHPFAKDFRALAFILKANADIERVADHATSIAKTVNKVPPEFTPEWPTALVELGQRVPIVCHTLLRALMAEDAEAARAIVAGDESIDTLHRRLFDETLELMSSAPNYHIVGLLVYRVGRELERIGDLMANIAEDIVYLQTGQIIRHEKRRVKPAAGESSDGASQPA
ncbi:MAG: phosphate signaling complex protein PhoU [Phycisphaeraceae bacterium]|nr:phosphate signaling complex protein PhoU [Phycisphaeraceae bacterium]